MDEQANFNLIDEPWIRVRGSTGAEQELSILELFRQASRLKCLSNDLPTQDFAILRVLLAILQRAISPMLDELDEDVEPTEVWGMLWEAFELPIKEIEAYLSKWHDRFDLFDLAHPFMQVPSLGRASGRDMDDDEESYLKRIIADVPGRKMRRLFSTRQGAGIERLSFSEAARWLIHTQAFDTNAPKSPVSGEPVRYIKKGKSYPGGVSWCGKLGCIYIEGDSIRETLLLNLDLRAEREDQKELFSDDDLPTWEMEPSKPADGHEFRSFPPTGRANLYTWQTRWIRLIPGGGYVADAVVGSGDVLAESPMDLYSFEDMTSWERVKGSMSAPLPVLKPKLHDMNKSLWRGLDSLFDKLNDINRGKPNLPGIVQWLDCLDGVESDRLFGLHAIGLKYDESMQSSIVDSMDDRLELSSDFFGRDGERLVSLVCGCIDKTESSIKQLRWLGANLYLSSGGCAGKDKNGKRVVLPASVYLLERQAYSDLDEKFRRWLIGLNRTSDAAVERRNWYVQVRGVLEAIKSAAVNDAGPTAVIGSLVTKSRYEGIKDDYWMTTAKAELVFNGKINALLPLEGDVEQEKGPTNDR